MQVRCTRSQLPVASRFPINRAKATAGDSRQRSASWYLGLHGSCSHWEWSYFHIPSIPGWLRHAVVSLLPPHHPLSLPLCQRGLVRPALPLQTHLNSAKIKGVMKNQIPIWLNQHFWSNTLLICIDLLVAGFQCHQNQFHRPIPTWSSLPHPILRNFVSNQKKLPSCSIFALQVLLLQYFKDVNIGDQIELCGIPFKKESTRNQVESKKRTGITSAWPLVGTATWPKELKKYHV